MKVIKNELNYFESFSSLAEFKAGLERDVTGIFVAKVNAGEGSLVKDFWAGTETYEEAEKLLNEGYDVGAETLMKKVLAIHNEAPKPRMTASVTGSAPIVANAIIGYPRSMWAMKQVAKPTPTRRVFIINTAGSAVENEKLLQSGAVMLNVCNHLEMNGVRTEINIIPKFSWNTARNNKTYTHGCMIKLKDYRESFSFKKMAYPIAHTSMFRRHGFHFLETMGSTATFKNHFIRYGFSYAKIHSQAVDKLKELGLVSKDDIVMTYGLIAECGFKLDKVMQELGLNNLD